MLLSLFPIHSSPLSTIPSMAATTVALFSLTTPHRHSSPVSASSPPLTVRTQRQSVSPLCAAAVLWSSSCGSKWQRMRCRAVLSIGQSEFAAEVLESELPVLVEFVADWCGPCRLISPVIEWASQEYQGKVKIVKVDHDANPGLIEEYKVYGLPGLILFKNGEEVRESRREGAITKAKLKEYLDNLLESKTAV